MASTAKNTTMVNRPGFLSNCGFALLTGAWVAEKVGVAITDIPEEGGVSVIIVANYYKETALDQGFGVSWAIDLCVR
ncbi:hypothetical protein PMm318_A59890 [Pseudomonas moorei]